MDSADAKLVSEFEKKNYVPLVDYNKHVPSKKEKNFVNGTRTVRLC